MKKKIIDPSSLCVAEIFCGAGGLSVGFKNATASWPGGRGERFEIVYGVDRDENAISTFRAIHFPDVDQKLLDAVAPCKDVTLVTADEILATIKPRRRLDVLIGGPSCQGVSPAGLRNPNDNRNAMLLAFIRLVKELQPRWFLMENVPGLTHSNNRELLGTILTKFEAIKGYRVAGEVLLAADHGIPQLRYRLFIVGTNTSAPIRFPSTQVSEKGSVSEFPTVREAIFDLMDHHPLKCTDKITASDLSTTNGSPPNHYYRNVADINLLRMKTIRPGEDWKYMPIGLLPEGYFATRASDQKGAYGRLLWDWPAYTMTNSCCNLTAGVFTHPQLNRVLTVREAARIQSFEDHHIFKGSVESQYRQVGNAVPPKLAQAVAEGILYCHFQKQEAKSWGARGRITLEVIKASSTDPKQIPVLTPRKVHPLFDRRSSRKSGNTSGTHNQAQPKKSAWDASQRESDPRPSETKRLRKLAEQPGNYRAAKRARTILQFLDGVPKETIVKEANVSETSIRKWIDGYFREGLDGWRAYHTPIDEIQPIDAKLRYRLKAAVSRARRTLLSPRTNGRPKNGNNSSAPRLHMNSYLSGLINRFGKLSVADVICELENHLNNGLGTVYVGDLLAMADVILEGKIPTGGAARKKLLKQRSSPLKRLDLVSHKTKSISKASRKSQTKRS